MSIDIDDPRLTAYALGELDPPDREQIEQALAYSPELREEVEQIRQVAALLADELAAEPMPHLTPAQERALCLAAQPRSRPAQTGRTIPLRSLLALAAGVAILASLAGLIVYSLFLPPPSPTSVVQPPWPGTPSRAPTRVPTPGAEMTVPEYRGTEPPGPKGSDTPFPGQSAAPVGHVPLALDLPRPQFIGTPENIRVEALRPKRTGQRPMPMIPNDVVNAAAGTPVTSSDPAPVLGELKMITDGKKEGPNARVELGPGKQWVQIDLQAEHEIHVIVFWHYFLVARVYHDVAVQVADDPDFITNVRTLFNNDRDNSLGLGVGTDQPYVDSHEGELVVLPKPVKARYVRLYSAGNTSNDLNHYVEVEVYARAVKQGP